MLANVDLHSFAKLVDIAAFVQTQGPRIKGKDPSSFGKGGRVVGSGPVQRMRNESGRQNH
ncbi:hypothetical protein MPNT_560003 [Candidatus Methylacidithermus pantelleriae]|uniref:Uncharacterized protein n=1 Tax=Candidatus Methylacidithermus pantelleriae TaxID=2744239 RepID=A0A8J2FTL4_9BACT|nr:hypothetical protein MPNT_560003 [Candidatus Methylacidithermus pantelleriae]